MPSVVILASCFHLAHLIHLVLLLLMRPYMVITRYPLQQNNGNLTLPFFMVITQLLSWIIFINDFICILKSYLNEIFRRWQTWHQMVISNCIRLKQSTISWPKQSTRSRHPTKQMAIIKKVDMFVIFISLLAYHSLELGVVWGQWWYHCKRGLILFTWYHILAH